MKFIKDVTTLEELKRVYKKLALKYHPDMGGTDKEMAQINNEYEALFDKLKNTHKNKEGEYYQKLTTFVIPRIIIKKVKIQATEWEKIFVNPLFDKDLASRI